MVALFGLIFKPSIITTTNLGIRLNTSTQKLAAIAQPDYWLQNQPFDQASTSSIEISDPHQILVQHPHLNQLEIQGDGLTESQWRGFPNIKIDYDIPDLKVGLINTEWNKQLNLGETLLISGNIQVPQNSDLVNKKLIIKLFDPALDKVSEIEIEAEQRFSIQTQPKLAGNLNYTVEVSVSGSIDSKQPLLQQSIHTSVVSRNDVRILVIQSAPSFETKQLQNWAAERGAKFVVKTKISRDKYIHRSTNFSELSNFNLSVELFNRFDLVILDGRGFIELSETHRQWLTESVEKGLGVLILADETLLKTQSQADLLSGMQLEEQVGTVAANLSWLDNNNRWTQPTEFVVDTLAATIKLDQGLVINAKKLVVTAGGKVIAQQQDYQSGHIAINIFNRSYEWVTLGQSRAHSQYWQSLIANIATRRPLEQMLEVAEKQLNFTNQLTQICVDTKQTLTTIKVQAMEKPSIVHELLLEKSTDFDSKYCGSFWPEKSGWYQSIVSNSTILDSQFYVESAADWPAQLQREKIKATMMKQKAYQQSSNSEQGSRAISLWIFWWLMVVSASILWIEKKFIASEFA
jgi:hypothetical protein